jgi:hypothetical protein
MTPPVHGVGVTALSIVVIDRLEDQWKLGNDNWFTSKITIDTAKIRRLWISGLHDELASGPPEMRKRDRAAYGSPRTHAYRTH